MKAKDIDNGLICKGDFVIDRSDNNCIRQIAKFIIHSSDSVSVNMVDGGAMGLNEIKWDDIRLESEVE